MILAVVTNDHALCSVSRERSHHSNDRNVSPYLFSSLLWKNSISKCFLGLQETFNKTTYFIKQNVFHIFSKHKLDFARLSAYSANMGMKIWTNSIQPINVYQGRQYLLGILHTLSRFVWDTCEIAGFLLEIVGHLLALGCGQKHLVRTSL